MTSVLADTIPGIRVVKAFAQEHREIERFRRANDRVLQANDRVNTALVVLRADGHAADRRRPAGGLGRSASGDVFTARHHRRHADGLRGLHQPLLHAGWIR